MVTPFNYTRMINIANRLLIRYGQSGILRKYEKGLRTSRGKYPLTSTDYVVTIVLIGDKRVFSQFDQVSAGGTQIELQDKFCFLSVKNLSVSPALNDQIIDANGVTYTIQIVENIDPGATTVIYKLGLKQ